MFLAGALFATNGNGIAAMLDKPFPESMAVQAEAADNSTAKTAETFQLAAVDFCYAGSIIDPATGESVDLFVICDEDGAEQNMDLA
jgi:hypothetical protein